MKYWVGCYYSSHLDEVASFCMVKKDQGVTWDEHIIHVRDLLGQLLNFQRQAARQILLKCAKLFPLHPLLNDGMKILSIYRARREGR